MQHVLDNPAWNALISGNRQLAHGSGQAKHFDKEISPFVGLRDNSAGNFQELYELLPHNGPALFVAPRETDIPLQWKVLNVIKGLQMVYEEPGVPADTVPEPIALTDEDVPQMVALAKLTNPGPFSAGTIKFGHYHGIFEGDKLVAMAGRRLHAFNYAEVSAVCTHPDHTGHGYARQLLLSQVQRIKAAAEIPFLHVRDDNERAIKVYESLGFATRTKVYFYVLLKRA